MGHSLRTSVIPEAVLWYTGEAMDDDDDEDEEGDYDEVCTYSAIPACPLT